MEELMKNRNKWIKNQLLNSVELSYQKFSNRLLPGVTNLLGVRLPIIRKMAKELSKGDWKEYLEKAVDDSFEEVMLQGMVIGYVKADLEELLPYIEQFIPKISNWSICDSFCSSLKITKKYPKEMWDFLQKYLEAEEVYFVRFGIVMLIFYYMDIKYIDRIFHLLNYVKIDDYYVKMAVAWAICTAYLTFPEKTIYYLENNMLDDITYNQALQKIIESSQVKKEEKEKFYNMKRK